jgi:sigma-B regulation protein RsbU (phosphoserine phosphatase)
MHEEASMVNTTLERSLGDQLRDRRDRLARTIAQVGDAPDLLRLLAQVDSVLERLGTDGFGVCEVCGEPCDDDELLAHPMTPYCLCRLDPERLEALQRDLDLAWRVQAALLPAQDRCIAGWQIHFRYQPAGPVSGDYCDVLGREGDGDSVYFLLGDVSGKGIAAAFLMAQVNALVRSLVEQGVSVPELVERANRHLGRSTRSSHFVTLVCGRADSSGEVEICNAGHCPPIVARGSRTELLDSTGFPLGIAPASDYGTCRVSLGPGDSLILYTDGIVEAPGPATAYGTEALVRAVASNHHLPPARLAEACLGDLARFQNGTARSDDLTLMVVRRSGLPGLPGSANRPTRR